MTRKSYAIILCGGSGTRLWPLSRTLRPKQLLPLNGEQTLLQQTVTRLASHVPAQHIFTVTHQDHRFDVKGQIAEILPDALVNVLAEPCARNTLPAVAWAVNRIWQSDPEAMIGIFPSDHAVDNQTAFLDAWQTAECAAAQGYFSLLGIKPTNPATGYGYIQPASILNTAAQKMPAYRVERFVEKPDVSNAERFVRSGYLWNSGMFVFRADYFMQMLERYQPEIYRKIAGLSDDRIVAAYAELPNISVDYGLAEKVEKAAVVPVDMSWSDLGSWDSIYHKHEKNSDNNVVEGDVISLDTRNSLLWTTHGLLATLGVDNLAVVQTADATLICDRRRTEDIKALVSMVSQHKAALTETHTKVYRPWGTYTVLEEKPNFRIKRITVNPGAKLSMQMHVHRSEHWVVVEGTAKVTNGDKEIILHENESTYIPRQHKHRLENPGQDPLHIIEVQCGDYVGEDDIIRFEDTYGR
jgi:mannose-1-phosphate guanylyltransferase/mannose-6-phosphate isomerase